MHQNRDSLSLHKSLDRSDDSLATERAVVDVVGTLFAADEMSAGKEEDVNGRIQTDSARDVASQTFRLAFQFLNINKIVR